MPLLAEQISSPSFWISIGVACVAVLASAVAAALALRQRRLNAAAPAEIQQSYSYLTTSLKEADEQAERLRTALHEAETERRHLKRLWDIQTTLDLEQVAARLLDSVGAVDGVDGALLVALHEASRPLVRSRGLSPDEEEEVRLPLADLVGSTRARSVEIAYHYRQGLARPGDIEGGVMLPLEGAQHSVAYLFALWRSGHPRPAAPEIESLEELAEVAAHALANAVEFERVREASIRDSLTSLYSRSFFHEELDRQVMRARRYRRPLGLILLDIDNFKEINTQLGHLEADAVLGEVAARLVTSIRSADIAGRVGGDEFGVILPESNRLDAEHLYERVRLAAAAAPSLTRVQVTLSAGVAEYHDDDASSLFNRADVALKRAKRIGKAQVVVDHAESRLDEAEHRAG